MYASGWEVPELEDRPELRQDLMHVWNAFLRLNKRRPPSPGGGLARIPFAEIEAYLNLQGYMEPVFRGEIMGILEELDEMFCEMIQEEAQGDHTHD